MTETPALDLAAIRAELDRLDDQILALAGARAALVREVARAKGPNAPFLRPGREAQIMRRLMQNRPAGLPAPVMARLFRELIAGLYSEQGGLSVAIGADQPNIAWRDVARDHFSSQCAIDFLPPREAIVAARLPRVIALLPAPRADSDWWLELLPERAPQIVARLPLWVEPQSPVLWMVANLAPEPSGDDITLLAAPDDVAVAGEVLAAKNGWRLIAQDGWAAPQDARVKILGAYARPVSI